jgi:hypothetical protein
MKPITAKPAPDKITAAQPVRTYGHCDCRCTFGLCCQCRCKDGYFLALMYVRILLFVRMYVRIVFPVRGEECKYRLCIALFVRVDVNMKYYAEERRAEKCGDSRLQSLLQKFKKC